MSQTYLPLSSLAAPKGNPRKTFSQRSIAGLAQSIKSDGVLQNLTVIPQENGRYRIHIGKRRFLALQMLKRNGDIDDAYSVPVDIKENLDGGDALRIATVENVQREALNPVDEAEAFNAMLRGGASLSDVAAQTGFSENTVRRRVALASLSKEAKAMVRSGALSLAVAEAMTVGNEAQQRQIVEAVQEGAHLTGEDVRSSLLDGRPAKSAALFDSALYAGTYTTDLFGDENATFFDDVDAFQRLQKEAVEDLAEKHRRKAKFVDVFNGYGAPWWQYREANKGEKAGVVINLSPSGAVEIRKGMIRKHDEDDTSGEQAAEPQTEKARPEFGPSLLCYLANEKTIALMGALAERPRKMMEVAAVLLLSAHLIGNRVRIEPHSCLRDKNLIEARPRGFAAMAGTAQALAERLGLVGDEEEATVRDIFPLAGNIDEASLHQMVRKLSDDDLGYLIAFIPLAAFGKDGIGQEHDPNSLFASVACDLAISVRDWWTPDMRFLSMLKRSQLQDVAIESGASVRLGRLDSYKKKDMVTALASYFRRTADPSTELDEVDAKGRSWLPRLMRLTIEEQLPIEDAV